MRKLLTFRWMSFHVLVFGCTVLFCILGHWQWDVGDTSRGTLRNFAYGVEWWVFAVILLGCWYRLLHQELKGAGNREAKNEAQAAGPKAPRYRVPAPKVSITVDEDEDPEMAAYNRYLSALHERDLSGKSQ